MSYYTLIATTAFGLESYVARELHLFGCKDIKTDNGKVSFTGDVQDIVRCNIWLRCADRLLIKMNEFKAIDFEELYQGVLSIPWENFIPENGKMHVVGKSIKSTLFSVSDCQSIVKKAVIEAMKRKYSRSWFSEDGPVYKIEIALLKDIATVTIDTSGAGLHKRGYRQGQGDAPIRETLAAAMVMQSRWDYKRIFADPFCGSGTIAIEAALIGKNIAPGLYRNFIAEDWPNIPKKIWQSCRDQANEAIKENSLSILASDIDKRVFQKARNNAENAGIAESITFQKKPVEEFSSSRRYGCIVCNPPFGERMSDRVEVEKLYRTMGEVFTRLDTWSFFILSAHPEFQKHFGRTADKNRKLYNGRIKCYLYQYMGPLPNSRI